MPPLAGKRILITRSRNQASALAASLAAYGAETILIPTIEIAPPASFTALDLALAYLSSFDWLVFTSSNAVQSFAERAAVRGIHTPDRILTAAIGPETARAAQQFGLRVNLVPPQANAESLLAALLPLLSPGTRLLFPRAAAARDLLPQALAAAGIQVTIVEAYRNIIPPDSASQLHLLFANPAHHPDAITFTSSSTASNLLTLLEAENLILPATILRASIGPITSETLSRLNLPPHVESPEATIPALVETLVAHLTRRPR